MAKRKKITGKKTYKAVMFAAALIISGFFAKENIVQQYAQPVIGVVSGDVIKVNDGDTLTILNSDSKKVKIRLYGIDAPELNQDFGESSKEFLLRQVSGKHITVNVMDIDQYKRSVGRIFLNDLDINRAMVEAGCAWVYPQYCKIPERAQWEDLQQTAKAGKKGLWNNDNPVPPWKWRKGIS